VVGGDLNIHTHSNSRPERARARPILDLFGAIGLHDLVRFSTPRGLLREGDQDLRLPCPCDDADCMHVMTHRHPRAAPGSVANNDYLFATSALADRLVDLEIDNGDQSPAWRHTDQAPLIATIDHT
jgi:hypothetical protein